MIILKQPMLLDATVVIKGKEQQLVESGYAITFDDCNIILNKLSISTSKGSKSYGQQTLSPIGFYNNISSLVRGMLSKQLLIDGAVIDSIKELEGSMERFAQGICKSIESVNKN